MNNNILKLLINLNNQAQTPDGNQFDLTQQEPVDSFTENILMKNITNNNTPMFDGENQDSFVKPGIGIKRDFLPPSPTNPAIQSLLPAANQKPIEPPPLVIPAQQNAVKEVKQKQLQEKENVAEQANVDQSKPELSELEKLLASYGNDKSELKDALDRRNARQRNLLMTRGAEKIGAAIGGYKSDNDYLQGWMNLAEQEANDAQKIKADKKDDIKFGFDMEKAKNQMTDEKSRIDANSEVSKMGKASMAELYDRIGMSDQANKIRNSALSIKQLEDVYGQMNVQNYISMYEAQQSRAEQARILAGSKEEAKKDKKTHQQESLITHMSDKIKQVDDKVGYNKALTDYEMLQERLASGKFDSVSDLTATYALMKAMDPGSVVRESEFENLVKTQGGFEKLKRMPDRFFKGNIYSPQFRQKLVQQFGDVVNARRKQLMKVLEPDLKRAKDLGIDESYIISPSTIKSFEQFSMPSGVAKGAAAELAKRRGK